jgi:N-acetylgalactosamine kinase
VKQQLPEAVFQRTFPDAGEPRVARAPGRVNLIGEHIDYQGLSVLPMAIDRSVRMAYSTRAGSRIDIASVAPSRFPAESFDNSEGIALSGQGSWANYCKVAVNELNTHFGVRDFPGMSAVVAGTVPVGAGLSSSSALVVSFALAYLDVLGLRLDGNIDRLGLADVLARAERGVGTESGGMDQAILLCGEPGCAMKIDFGPLRCEPVPLSEAFSFVVCDSMVAAEKSGAARHRYNEGPQMSRLICAIVEKRLREEIDPELGLVNLSELWLGSLCLTHDEAAELFDDLFAKETMTWKQVARYLEMDVAAIRERYAPDLVEPPMGLPFRARARHIRTEYRRVEQARDALLSGDLERLGDLMNASHASCADDYGVSAPELDRLVGLALEHGALGARLTGAGFGGFTVSLVRSDEVESFVATMKRIYYARERDVAPGRDVCFEAVSGPGAGYEKAGGMIEEKANP